MMTTCRESFSGAFWLCVGGFMFVTAHYCVNNTFKTLNRCLGIQLGFYELYSYVFTKQVNIWPWWQFFWGHSKQLSKQCSLPQVIEAEGDCHNSNSMQIVQIDVACMYMENTVQNKLLHSWKFLLFVLSAVKRMVCQSWNSIEYRD